MAAKIRELIAEADPIVKAWILLGVNAGFNNADVADLRLTDIDFEAAWLASIRKKTAVDREAPLWPATLASTARANRSIR